MTARELNLVIEKGATFSKTFTWKNPDGSAINLTGYTARMQVRQSKKASSTLLSLTTENSRITLGGAAGTIVLTITATDTAAISWATGVYDLEMITGSTVKRLLEGAVTVSEEVTR